ncbi:hypothetical protein acdb102_31470 [Acidothermaceae bacterium B102]|nr:hypothetical protein acdb102_31470 [Acidothermaceae bacterium B102]
MIRRLRSDDEGSLIPLILFYFVVAATLVLVVTDASKYYLARRSLQSAADGAALASAQSVSSQGVYSGLDHGALLLDGDVCQAVADYGAANHLADRFDELTMVGFPGDTNDTCIATGATRVTVVARDKVRLPLVSILGVVDDKVAGGITLTVTAHAELQCATC